MAGPKNNILAAITYIYVFWGHASADTEVVTIPACLGHLGHIVSDVFMAERAVKEKVSHCGPFCAMLYISLL